MPSLWNYLREYPGRYADQFTQGMQQYARTRNPVAALGAINPTTPFIQDAALQAGGLIAPHTNRLSQAVSQSSENLGLGPLAIPEVTDKQLAPFLMLGMGSPTKMGFYSPSGKALTTAPGKGTSQQYLAHLKKEPGATKEGKQTGLIQKLEEAPGTLTKEEVVSMWNPIELSETVRAGHRDHVIGGLSVGGVDFYRDGMPVDYDPYLLAKRAGLDEPTAAEHARAVLIEDVLIDEWKLREGWEERGEQGVVDVVRQKISERIASNEEQLEYDPDDDALREQILELRDIQNRIPHLYTVQMDEASRHPLKYAESEGLNLPGGEEPKEILVQLPDKGAERLEQIDSRLSSIKTTIENAGDMSRYDNFKPEVKASIYEQRDKLLKEQADLLSEKEALNANPLFRGGHWDEPNVLAHIRTNKRDVGGVSALHAEEFQSDWHQQGQKKGYVTETEEEVRRLSQSDYDRWFAGKGDMSDAEYSALLQRIREWDERMSAAGTGVPDAPYKKDWHELAFKRFLMEGINDPSVDRITWTSGDVQADRYNLAKYINEIEAEPNESGEFSIAVKYKEGNVEHLTNVPSDKLSDYVGKEMAEKIVADKGGTYSGLDLEIGGEFHKNLYDKKIPQFAKKFLKKYGVEPKKIPSWGLEIVEGEFRPDIGERKTAPSYEIWSDFPEEFVEGFETREEAEEFIERYQENLWYIDITPEMRRDLQQKGVPLAMNPFLRSEKLSPFMA